MLFCYESSEEEEHEEKAKVFNEAARQRKVYKCPKPSCAKKFKSRSTKKLAQHIQGHKSDGPDALNEYQRQLNRTLKSKDKQPKKKCNLCGKMVAGSPYNMALHQKTSGCKSASHQ